MGVNGVLLGVRIEFYEELNEHRRPDGPLVGAALKDEGFVGASVPCPGDLVSTVALAGDVRDCSLLRDVWMGVPFTPVAAIEHYPVPVDSSGQIETWWTSWTTPSASLIFHARAPRSADSCIELAQVLTARGWSVDAKLVRFAETHDVTHL